MSSSWRGCNRSRPVGQPTSLLVSPVIELFERDPFDLTCSSIHLESWKSPRCPFPGSKNELTWKKNQPTCERDGSIGQGHAWPMLYLSTMTFQEIQSLMAISLDQEYTGLKYILAMPTPRAHSTAPHYGRVDALLSCPGCFI